MSMLSDFFKDSGYGNYYQGSAKNTSGQWYDPANYGGLKAFDPNKPNDPGSIGPGTYGRASMGNWLGNFSAMPAYGGAQRAVSPLTAPGNWQTGGMQRVLSYGNARQAGQGVQLPQSAYAYTLADLLRNYYA